MRFAICTLTCLIVAQAAEAQTNEAYSTGDVEAFVFDIDYTMGFGGMTIAEYRPVYLFKDGAACKCGALALEDLSSADDLPPHQTGRWRSAGGGYAIAYADGSEETIAADTEPPVALPPGFMLDGRYRSISGGGNTALGGSFSTVAVKDLTFFTDGSFAQESVGGGTAPVVTAWSKRGAAGTWSVDGPTLTLSYRDGRTARTSLFHTAGGDRVGGMPQVLWIGGEGYARR
jgi:hypothetical protein